MAVYFGIRHFSPACAAYVLSFLERVQPETVLIEGPADGNEWIAPLCSMESAMPAALLAYTTEPPVQTVLWPFAEFSPEYQAMRWAVAHGVPVRFCDLPAACVLAEQSEASASADVPAESVYGKMERVTGQETDVLWEYQFEQNENEADFLAAVEAYGASIREFSVNDAHNQLREAYMRRVIAETEQSGVPTEKIAVITGAFHTAGLKNVLYTAEDAKLTAHLPTVPSQATLMPYSYYKLSNRSGYGAGSRAPAYFEILWNNRQRGTLADSGAEYLSRLAGYQRTHGNVTSSAEVMEALRLAETLAAMRGGTHACLTDLRDAAITCMGHGSFGEISLACADTEIGTKIGSLPEGTVCTALQTDFQRQLKVLKLERYRKAKAEQLPLDLRENLRVKSEQSAFLGLHRSFFLHQLSVIGIRFGKQLERQQDNATWAELWELQWNPETEIEVVEASLMGDTVEQTALAQLREHLANSQLLSRTTELLWDAFQCGLTALVPDVIAALQRQSAGCFSPTDVGTALGNLSGIVRFGSIRKIDTVPLIPLMQQLFLRFCLELPQGANCNYDAAAELLSAMSAVNDACLSHDFLEQKRFLDTLRGLAEDDSVQPLLSGFAGAILLERGEAAPDVLAVWMCRRLSGGIPPQDGAMWFEGLSRKNHRALISRLSIWEALCDFVATLEDTEFRGVLICLRRTFAEFSGAEKAEIAENIGEVLGVSPAAAAAYLGQSMTAGEQAVLEELDDFDFEDI